MNTIVDARNYVIECIEASGLNAAAEYDIDKIVSDLYFEFNTYDFADVPPTEIYRFWETVECYQL